MGNQQSNIIEAVAVIDTGKIQGTVVFTQKDEHVSIHIDIKGLKKNAKHGFHIHETGDLREGCKSCCAHSKTTGHSGARIACSVIGIGKNGICK